MNHSRSPLALVLLPTLIFTTACPAPPGEGEGEGVSYYPEVGTILNENCVSCHQQGGIAPFPLDNYEDAKAWGEVVQAVTGSRAMPPWGMDHTDDCNTFHDARYLEDDEIATLAAWVEAGKLEGDSANAPTPPPGLPTLDRTDATLSPGVDYVPNQNVDDYRCFVVEPDTVIDGRFLTGFEVVPGAPEIVHHVILYRVDAAGAGTIANLDASGAGPGYTCYGGVGVSTADVLAGWAPGVGAIEYPTGTGLRLGTGDVYIAQIHYNPAAAAGQSDRTTLKLQLENNVADEAFLTIWADFTMSLPPGEAEYWHSYSQPVGGNVKVYGVFPHMHQLGRKMEIYAAGAGVNVCLADVPRYDFNWQRFYFYEQPIDLTASANINVNCGYDTTSRTQTTRFGEATTDEMCVVLWYYTLN